MRKKKKKKGKKDLNKKQSCDERERERGRQECTSERKRVWACVYVGVCVTSKKKRRERVKLARRTVICLFYTQHTLIRNTYIHTHTHPPTHTYTPTYPHLYRRKKRGKKCACVIAERDARSPLLLYYYRVTPYVCLYYRGVHLNRWSF